MPTISLQRDDLEALIAGPDETPSRIPLDQLEQWLMLVKGELKGTTVKRVSCGSNCRTATGRICGVAKGSPGKSVSSNGARPFLIPSSKNNNAWREKCSSRQGWIGFAPYVAACTAVGYRVTASGLTQLIQTQEKLADIFGRKRRTVSIGLYPGLAPIVFPCP